MYIAIFTFVIGIIVGIICYYVYKKYFDTVKCPTQSIEKVGEDIMKKHILTKEEDEELINSIKKIYVDSNFEDLSIKIKNEENFNDDEVEQFLGFFVSVFETILAVPKYAELISKYAIYAESNL